MPAIVPLINGTNYSWNSVKVVLFGVPVVGITKLDYKAKQVKENNYGMGSEPVSRGIGNKEYEGSIELYVDELKRIIDASPDRDPLAIPPFDIQVIYGGTRVLPNVDVLQAVEFLENPFNASQGDSKILITIPLVIGGIKR